MMHLFKQNFCDLVFEVYFQNLRFQRSGDKLLFPMKLQFKKNMQLIAVTFFAF